MFRFILTSLRLACDLCMIPVLIIGAYSLKFKLRFFSELLLARSFGQIYHHAQVEPYIDVLGPLMFIWLTGFYIAGLYRPIVGLSPWVDEAWRVVKGVSIAISASMIFSFFYKPFPESRYVMLYAWWLGIVLLSIVRILILNIELFLYKKGVGTQKCMVLGTSLLAQDLVEKVSSYPILGYRYLGSFGESVPKEIMYTIKETFTFCGGIADLETVVRNKDVDHIFIATRLHNDVLEALINDCDRYGVTFELISEDLLLEPFHCSSVLDGVPLFSIKSPTNILNDFVKRLCDIAISISLIVCLWPLFCLIAIYIKWMSPQGPVFFFQERVGLNGRVFKMAKFRSMVPNAEKETGPVYVDEKDESRYFKGGRLLRGWSLDELPQLWNVLKGDMSLVGPRPERPHFVDELVKTVPYFNYRHIVKGGITGWAQIHGRSHLTRRPEQKLRYDMYYVHHHNVLLDLKILFHTIFVVLSRREVY